jgi:hypothetical protein
MKAHVLKANAFFDLNSTLQLWSFLNFFIEYQHQLLKKTVISMKMFFSGKNNSKR